MPDGFDEWLAEGAELIASGKECDAYPPEHRCFGDAERGKQPEVGGRETLAGGQGERSARQVLPSRAHVLPRAVSAADAHRPGTRVHVLLHHDGIGAGRQWGACHDAHASTFGDGALKWLAGQGRTGNRKLALALVWEACCSERITINGRIGMTRNIKWSVQIARENSPKRAAQCNDLDALYRTDGFEDTPARFGHRQARDTV